MPLSRRRRKKSTINITSLIDVLFLLLIFFMISSTFKEQPGMKLELPESKTADVSEIKELVLHVDLDSDNKVRLRLNMETISLDELLDRLNRVKSGEDQALVLKADRRVEHGTVVKIMDITKQSGIKKLIIATRPQSSEHQSAP